MENIRYFETQQAFESAYNGSDYIEPWVSYVNNGSVNYNMTEAQKMARYVNMPLTIESLGTGNVVFTCYNANIYQNTSYKKNDGEWTTITTSGATNIPVVAGDEVQFKGTNNVSMYYNGAPVINSTAQFKVKGNIMSMGIGSGFESADTITLNYIYEYFFQNATNLVSAKYLVLPATTLSQYCYAYMFKGCTGLVDAPMILPSETMSDYCYYYMFSGCTSLTSAPELPSTTLTYSCYNCMFDGCSSLVNAPALPATTLVDYCYYMMFNGCTSLERAPELPATTVVPYCYYKMFFGCTSLNYVKCLLSGNTSVVSQTESWLYNVSSTGTFVRDASSKTIAEMQGQSGYVWGVGASGIPNGWTIENV